MTFSEKDINKVTNHIASVGTHVREQYHETFLELVRADPERAIAELPKFIDGALSAGKNLFRGLGCGGPHEGVTTPFLNSIGLIYPALERDMREKALDKCFDFIDRQNYFLAQRNVEKINEPWLVADIITNRWLYFCGFDEYASKLENMATSDDFEKEFVQDGRLDCSSSFWLSFALARNDTCESDMIRTSFEERYPDLCDRTRDAIAAMINYQALHAKAKYGTSYEDTVDEKTAKYNLAWDASIREKLKEEKWILRPDTLDRLAQWSEERTQTAG